MFGASDLRDYRVETKLDCGDLLTIRAIQPADQERLIKYFQEMTAESRYLRFAGFRNSFTAGELEYVTNPNFLEHGTIVATLADQQSDEHMVGEASYVSLADGDYAECALSVLDRYRHQGIGTLLLEHLARLTEHWGVKQLRADILGSNRTALEFVMKRGFRPFLISHGVYHLCRPLAPAHDQSMARLTRADHPCNRIALYQDEDELHSASACAQVEAS
jgi:GNAT superfamily N-acetyltransferase